MLFIFLFIYVIFKIINSNKNIVKNNKLKIEKNKLQINENESLIIKNESKGVNRNLLIENNQLLITNNELLIENNTLLLTENTPSLDNNIKIDASLFSFGLLLSTVFVIVAQFFLFGTQYVVDRTALFLYPILALNMPTVSLLFGQKSKWAGQFTALVFTVFCTWHIIRTNNLTHYYEWWFDKNTFDVIKEMKLEYQKRQDGKPLKLHTYWTLQPAIYYYREEQHLDWLFEPFGWDRQVDSIKPYDFYFTFREDLPALQSKYEVIKQYDRGEAVLMKHK